LLSQLGQARGTSAPRRAAPQLFGVHRLTRQSSRTGRSWSDCMPNSTTPSRTCSAHRGGRLNDESARSRLALENDRPVKSASATRASSVQTHASPHPRGAWRCWANTGPIPLANCGVMWRFLAACWSSSGASSHRLERAWEGSIPFLGRPFPLLCMGFRNPRPQSRPHSPLRPRAAEGRSGRQSRQRAWTEAWVTWA
jgi:hypothetical protein